MAKTKFITLSLFGLFMTAESNAMNEIPSPPISGKSANLLQQENITNIDDCPKKLDYVAFMSAYEGSSKTVTPFGAQFEFDQYTVQISSRSMKLLDDLKKLGSSEILLIRNDQIERGRCVYTPLSKQGTAINSPAFGLSIKINSQGSQKTREMTPEEKNAQKMMIIDEALKRHADTLKKEGEEQKDITKNVGTALHAVSANPVLDATLEYTNPKINQKISFKIGTKLQDGMIDLDKMKITDDSHLIITTDPGVFFADHGSNVVVLIAPKSLINDNLHSSAAPFQPIMAKWDQTKVPIGIFFRFGERHIDEYKYLTGTPLPEMSQMDLETMSMRSQISPKYPFNSPTSIFTDEMKRWHILFR